MPDLQTETLQRLDFTVEGINLIVYLSDIATRITVRQGAVERDAVIYQHASERLGLDQDHLSYIGLPTDEEANRRIVRAARSTAELLLSQAQALGLSLRVRKSLGNIRQMRPPLAPELSAAS